MRLLVRSLGPVPEELNADGDSSVAELQALIKGSSALAETSASHSFRLVSRRRAPSPRRQSAAAAAAAACCLHVPSQLLACLPAPSSQVHRGRVLRDGTARLRDVLSEGDVVVALPAREVAPRRAARPPSRVRPACSCCVAQQRGSWLAG